jgi:hypothetical protein
MKALARKRNPHINSMNLVLFPHFHTPTCVAVSETKAFVWSFQQQPPDIAEAICDMAYLLNAFASPAECGEGDAGSDIVGLQVGVAFMLALQDSYPPANRMGVHKTRNVE